MSQCFKNVCVRTVVFLLCLLLIAPHPAAAGSLDVLKTHGSPKVANVYLRTPLTDAAVTDLSKWDLVVLGLQAHDNSKEQIKKLRLLNPNIVILAYVPTEEFPLTYYHDWEKDVNGIWHRLLRGITDDMWLHDDSGGHVSFWYSNFMLNVTNYQTGGQRWNDYLSSFVTTELLNSGLWDGIFYDNVFTDVSWINGGNIDTNNDKIRDSKAQIARDWQAGMNNLFALTRQKAGQNIILIGNGQQGYYSQLNGLYFENITDQTVWAEKMKLYQKAARETHQPTATIIGNNTLNTGKRDDYANVRFGLTTSLLEDGYYAFDHGTEDHSQLWWYDEYDVDLGRPVGTAVSRRGYTTYTPDVWTRQFDNGIAVVNSTNEDAVIDLGGEYEKIHGMQDKTVNDGTIVTETIIGKDDGQILLKTFSHLDDVLIPNGSFVRFFRADGTRARNGFFNFEEDYKAGDQVGRIDLDGNGLRDLIVISDGQIKAWRDDGVPLLRVFPYGANYTGELRVAVGNLNDDKELELIVAPPPSFAYPIKTFSTYGEEINASWYPFGSKYKGGYTVAVGNVDGKGSSEIIVGAGKGSLPTVAIFSNNYKKIREWYSYETRFRGGVSVATGDMDGNGTDEIIVSPGPGGRPLIKIFSSAGKALYPQIIAYGSFGFPGISVVTLDVDFDGKKEIVGVSKDVGL